MTPDLHGTVAPGFEPVRAAFAANFAERGEVGAGFAAFVEGRLVADLWGGEARPGVPWEEDTMAVVFSTTKGPTTLTVEALVDRGVLDVEAPVAAYRPQFAAAGKEGITLRHLLTHTSGVIDFPGYQAVVEDAAWWHDLDAIAAAFAGAAPAWEPGTAHGYHGVSFGLLLGEVVRRATGTTLGTVFSDLVAHPLGLDFFIGLPASQNSRVALLVDSPPVTDPLVSAYLSLFTPETLTGRAHFVTTTGITHEARLFNREEMWSAEFPSGGGIGTARALAVMYDALANGGSRQGRRIVSEESVAAFAAETRRGPDLVLLLETRYGLGYQRPTQFSELGPSDAAFGHAGLGGSVGFADPERRVSVGYVANQLEFPAPGVTSRAGALTDALYACLP
jgi:CubicO group peptidase (beta-lactamase class C family)